MEIKAARCQETVKELLKRGWLLHYFKVKQVEGVWRTTLKVFNAFASVRIIFMNDYFMVYRIQLPGKHKPFDVPCNPVGLETSWYIDRIEENLSQLTKGKSESSPKRRL
jgi:hypothetical protein